MTEIHKNDRVPKEVLQAAFAYDPATGIITWKHRSDQRKCVNSRLVGKPAGTLKRGYVQLCLVVDGRSVFFAGHRVAWLLHYGDWPETDLDHRNHKTADNRIDNLREATEAENSSHKNEVRGQVPYKGVSVHAKSGKFGAQIKSKHQHYWLGLFENADDAARVYDAKAKELHGDFAVTNLSLGLLS